MDRSHPGPPHHRQTRSRSSAWESAHLTRGRSTVQVRPRPRAPPASLAELGRRSGLKHLVPRGRAGSTPAGGTTPRGRGPDGRAPPCQGGGREFEPRRPHPSHPPVRPMLSVAQLEERRVVIAKVAGSKPVGQPTIPRPHPGAGAHGQWRSLVAHALRECGVGGSNPPWPTQTGRYREPVQVVAGSRRTGTVHGPPRSSAGRASCADPHGGRRIKTSRGHQPPGAPAAP